MTNEILEKIDQLGNITDNWTLLRDILKKIVKPEVKPEEKKKK